MKFKHGDIGTFEGRTMDIIVDSKEAPIKVKDVLIGAALITSGVIYLMRKAFRSGASAFEAGEYNTLEALGLIKDTNENGEA